MSSLRRREAPFFMSRLLSKLEARDNSDFGREMHCEKKEEKVANLINWLHQEAPLRSRGKITDHDNGGQRECGSRKPYHWRMDEQANGTSVANDKIGTSSRFLPCISGVNCQPQMGDSGTE